MKRIFLCEFMTIILFVGVVCQNVKADTTYKTIKSVFCALIV